ncbi:serine/arginine repetitive matrix protein 2-like [Contarinia nasturtii]|uniref:serine/arginine repetitive matrix protein 2-like n=1 Tax=Contarinia nasturtii TaxID=265458 RepID=UPI0012D49697|nr:serine/arginine repetitive matrix protein 2-like [Contarinia nasturtii]
MAKSSNRKSIEPMEDDEDLELLRLEALKSLKKDTAPAVSTSKSIADSHVIPVVGNVRPTAMTVAATALPVDKFYAPCEPVLVQPNLIHHPVPPYVNSGFEKMEISEPYLPQRLNPPPPFNEYVPFSVASNAPPIIDPITNVQLSPRTAAFVYENKQIIQRRQGKSPSHSPVPFRKSPGRWSRSPSPESWKYRRSTKSRSPAYPNHSPHFRNRSVSRSPQRKLQRHSPQPTHSRRNRTRSPIARNNFDGAHRTERRSPISNRRANSPNSRQPPRTWHGHPGQRDNGMYSRKSGSPRGDELNHRRRRTRSPTNAKSDVKRRTSSRSPNRKFARNNLNRPPRRSPPSKRFNNGNKSSHSGARNRYNHGQRNGSPSLHHRSHSPSTNHHHRRRSPTKNTMENGSTSSKSNNKDHLTSDQNEQQSMDVTSKNENDENTMNNKKDQNGEDDIRASSDSENSDSDNNDGIDLFASEESESENEGRFKLSSRSERKTNVPTVSFSELGKTTTAPAEVLLRDLDDLQTESNSHRRGPSRRDNDRNRNRRDDRRYNNRDRDRDNKDRERDRERERDRNRRDKERESSKSKSSGSWKSSKTEDSRKKEERSNDGNVKGEKKHFKSTFATVESEPRTKSPDGEKPVDVKNNEKRSTIQLKRSTKSSEKNVDTKNLQSTVVGSSTSEKRASPSNESSTTAKKPIHLRLGAMTNKWKPSKKTWRTEKV